MGLFTSKQDYKILLFNIDQGDFLINLKKNEKLNTALSPKNFLNIVVEPSIVQSCFSSFDIDGYDKFADGVTIKSIKKALISEEDLNSNIRFGMQKQQLFLGTCCLCPQTKVEFYIMCNIIKSNAPNVMSLEQYVGLIRTIAFYKLVKGRFDWSKMATPSNYNFLTGNTLFKYDGMPFLMFKKEGVRSPLVFLVNKDVSESFSWYPLETIAVSAFIFNYYDDKIVSLYQPAKILTKLSQQVENKARMKRCSGSKLLDSLLTDKHKKNCFLFYNLLCAYYLDSKDEYEDKDEDGVKDNKHDDNNNNSLQKNRHIDEEKQRISDEDDNDDSDGSDASGTDAEREEFNDFLKYLRGDMIFLETR